MKSSRWIVVAALILACQPSCSRQQNTTGLNPATAPHQSPLDAFQKIVQQDLRRQEIVGFAFAVFSADEDLLTSFAGVEDLAVGSPVRAQTTFRLASVSKLLTGIVAVKRHHQEKINLDTPVAEYVPLFLNHEPKLTVRSLLRHTGGIIGYESLPLTHFPLCGQSLSRLQSKSVSALPYGVGLIVDKPLLFVPGSSFHYSTLGYVLAGEALSQACDAPIDQQVQELIAKPLGLSSLRSDYCGDELSVTGYKMDIDGARIAPAQRQRVDWKMAGGGFVTNLNDFAALGKSLLDGTLLSDAEFSTLTQPANLLGHQGPSPAIGCFYMESKNSRLIYCHGKQEMGGAMLIVSTEKQLGLAMLTNSSYADLQYLSAAFISTFQLL